MIKDVTKNYNYQVIANEAKQSHSVNISRLLCRYAPRNDFLAELKA